MIAYDELVAALSQWRMRQGLPGGAADYLGEPIHRPVTADLPVPAEAQAAPQPITEISLSESQDFPSTIDVIEEQIEADSEVAVVESAPPPADEVFEVSQEFEVSEELVEEAVVISEPTPLPIPEELTNEFDSSKTAAVRDEDDSYDSGAAAASEFSAGEFTGEATTEGSYVVTYRTCDDQDPAACSDFTVTYTVTLLPVTGTTIGGLALAGFASLLLGFVLLAARRRQDDTEAL